MFFKLTPESCGQLGRRTLHAGDADARPLEVYRFEYEFHTWPTDPLQEVASLYIGTARLADAISNMNPKPSGIFFDKVSTVTTLECRRANADKELSEYKWFKITGQAGKEDFGMSANHELVVSERVYALFKPLLRRCGTGAHISEKPPDAEGVATG